jgi:hypothetical protein
VAFPDISNFPDTAPGPYERQMGRFIVGLLRLFAGRLPDTESYAAVMALAADPRRWSAGHAVFDKIRSRLLAAMDRRDRKRSGQYSFEESCCQALYNATEPHDPFDPSSPFFVVASALGLAQLVGVPLIAVAGVFAENG